MLKQQTLDEHCPQERGLGQGGHEDDDIGALRVGQQIPLSASYARHSDSRTRSTGTKHGRHWVPNTQASSSESFDNGAMRRRKRGLGPLDPPTLTPHDSS
jgi:hypothetical protein